MLYGQIQKETTMRHIALFMMGFVLRKAEKEKIGKDPIIQRAYDSMIENYKYTIIYLRANIQGTKKPSNKRRIHLITIKLLKKIIK